LQLFHREKAGQVNDSVPTSILFADSADSPQIAMESDPACRYTVTASCTPREWRANEDAPSSQAIKKDRTGLMVATCPHGVIAAGCWIKKGEQHIYSHLLFAYILHTFKKQILFYIYDIACMVVRGVQAMISNLPPDIRAFASNIRFIVPVWHARSHNERCQHDHTLAYAERGGISFADIVEHTFRILKTHHTSTMTHRNQSFALTLAARRVNAMKIYR